MTEVHERPDALLDRCYSFAVVEDGRIVSSLNLCEVFATEEAAIAAAQEHCKSLHENAGLHLGQGCWIFELQAVKFVGRPLLEGVPRLGPRPAFPALRTSPRSRPTQALSSRRANCNCALLARRSASALGVLFEG